MLVNFGGDSRPLSVQQAIERCSEAFTDNGLVFGHGTDNAWDEATWLVLHVCGLPDSQESLVVELEADQRQRVAYIANRRIAERVPLAYLLGETWCAGLPFYVEPGVIVPRSPLAQLLQHELRPWLGKMPLTILDMCCGSGCLGILAALVFPNSRVLLVDIDPQAVALARANVDRHDLRSRVSVQQSDLFGSLPRSESWDLILCNPPYVDANDMQALPPEYRAEPHLALAAGADGLSVLTPLVEAVFDATHPRLSAHGLLVGEAGNSSAALQGKFPDYPFIWPDLPAGGEGVFILRAQDLPFASS